MSGGSFDYLYCKDTEEFFALNSINSLIDMAVILKKEGYEDVSKDVFRLVGHIKSARTEIDIHRKQLKDVIRSVEWFDSHDFGPDTLREHIEMYRSSKKKEGDKNDSEGVNM